MNCPNCGAPTTLIKGGSHFFCGHCETYQFPRPIDGSADGVVASGDVAEVRCPVCDDQQLACGVVDSTEIDYCPQCRGILLLSESLPLLLAQRKVRECDTNREPMPLNPEELQRRIACPFCGRAMEVHPYHGPGNAVIDSCSGCRLVWLDHGEFTILHRARGARVRMAKLGF